MCFPVKIFNRIYICDIFYFEYYTQCDILFLYSQSSFSFIFHLQQFYWSITVWIRIIRVFYFFYFAQANPEPTHHMEDLGIMRGGEDHSGAAGQTAGRSHEPTPCIRHYRGG